MMRACQLLVASAVVAGCAKMGVSLDNDMPAIYAEDKSSPTVSLPWNVLGECLYTQLKSHAPSHDHDYREFSATRRFEIRTYFQGPLSAAYLAHYRGTGIDEETTKLEIVTAKSLIGSNMDLAKSAIATCVSLAAPASSD